VTSLEGDSLQADDKSLPGQRPSLDSSVGVTTEDVIILWAGAHNFFTGEIVEGCERAAVQRLGPDHGRSSAR